MSASNLIPEPLAKFLRLYGETAGSVFTQALGAQYRVLGEVRPSTEAGEYQFRFSVAGPRHGALIVALRPADALRLARQFVGSAVDADTEPNDEDREALEELLRQSMGQFTAELRPEVGEVRFELLPQPYSTDAPASAAVFELAYEGGSTPITVFWDEELAASFAPAPAVNEPVAAAKPVAVKPAEPKPAATTAIATTVPVPAVPPNVRPENLELLLGVELPATLRFGQKRMRLAEIVQLSAGAVVDLDRQVEEPVELLVDGRLIARGEVVIVDGNYGLRVTELATANARMAVLS